MKRLYFSPFPGLSYAMLAILAIVTNGSIMFAQPQSFDMHCGTLASTESSSSSSESPICTDTGAIKYLQVAFHFILSEDVIVRQYPEIAGLTPFAPIMVPAILPSIATG